VIVGKDVGAAPRGDNWNAHSLCEPNEGVRAAGAQDSRAGKDQRPTCVGEQMEDLAHERRVRLGVVLRAAGGRLPVRNGRSGNQGIHHIRGHREQDRARPAPGGDRDCPLEDRPSLAWVLDLYGPLHDWLEGPDEVHLLKCLAAPQIASDLADDGDDRRRIRSRGVQADRQIARTNCTCADADGRSSSELRHRLGHKGGRPFVARSYHSNASGGHPFEKTQDALARNREGNLYAGTSQPLS
jgi:hypothetical protein